MEESSNGEQQSVQRFSVWSILQGIVLCATAALCVLVPSKRQMFTRTGTQAFGQQQLWSSTPPTKGCNSSNSPHLGHCKRKTFLLACPRDRYSQSGEEDPFGTRPFVCPQTTGLNLDVSEEHVFNVSMCKGIDEIHLQVAHIKGLLRDPVNRLYSTGPDFITAQIVGPELRVVPFDYKGNGIYEATLRAAVPGHYTFDITVLLTPETMEGPGRPFWLTRNFVLAANETWHASEVSDEELLLDEQGIRLSAMGRWVAMYHFPNATTAMKPCDGFIGYRCQHLGEYAWTPRIKKASLSWSRFKDTEATVKCLQSIKPAGANFSRLLMAGDSQSRNTFNSLLDMVWPDNSTMRATKNFKSVTDSQCFGGPEEGIELCFQWAAYGIDAETLQRYLQEFDRVTFNFGQHLVSKAETSLTGWLQMFEPQISSLARAVHDTPGALERVVWLQTHLLPPNNLPWMVDNKDRRRFPLLLDLLARTSSILRELQLPEMTVAGLLLPYHDCTKDAAHFAYGLPEQIVREKLLPWICPELDADTS